MGRKIRYQRKYCDVQTLLKVTNAIVWVSMARGREDLEMASGMRRVESVSWGRKARDSKRTPCRTDDGVVDCWEEER